MRYRTKSTTDSFITESINIHGNPSIYDLVDINPINKLTYGELYNSTILKMHNIQNAGYNFVCIWEAEWKILNKSIMSTDSYSELKDTSIWN